jgi:hypothetical protein
MISINKDLKKSNMVSFTIIRPENDNYFRVRVHYNNGMTIEQFLTETFVMDIINYVKQDAFVIKVKDFLSHPDSGDIGEFKINYLEQDFTFTFKTGDVETLKNIENLLVEDSTNPHLELGKNILKLINYVKKRM